MDARLESRSLTVNDALPGCAGMIVSAVWKAGDMIELTPSTTEGTDPANRSSNTVELATNSSWTGLGSKHTKTVARTKFTEA